MICSNAGEISPLSLRGDGGCAERCSLASSVAESAEYGSCPVSISKRITPSEYTSDAGEGGPPAACSGEKYCGDPHTNSARSAGSIVDKAPYIPKSSIFFRPS